VAVSPSALEPSYAGTVGPAKPTARERRAIYVLTGFGALVALLLGLTQNPIAAAAPVLLAIAVFGIAKMRSWYLLVGLMFVYQAIGITPVMLEGGRPWVGPGIQLYLFFTRQLPVHMSGLEACYVAIFALAGIRAVLGIRIDSEKRQPGSRMLYIALVWILVAIVVLEVRGVLRGYANIQQSLWQFHGLLWIPILAMFVGSSMRSAREAPTLAWMFTLAASFKILYAAYLMHTVAAPAGIKPDAATGHEDSILYVAVLFMWLAAAAHRPTKGALMRFGLISGWILYGLVLNNRRIAYVGLAVSLLTLYMLFQGRLKRIATKAVLYSLPFLVIYLAVGKNKPRGIFKPAAMIMSVGEQKDASSQTRDIENFNLIQTLKPHIIMGNGWGYEYNEVVRAFDISTVFEQYKFIAHNSILWLIAIGGMVGFALLWVPFAVAFFLGIRAYRSATDWMDKTSASTALAVLSMFVVQAWGDMGTQGMMSGQVIACALAIIAKLAYSTGAWPAGVKVFGDATEPRPRLRRRPAAQ